MGIILKRDTNLSISTSETYSTFMWKNASISPSEAYQEFWSAADLL
jgi:hypothetical protein